MDRDDFLPKTIESIKLRSAFICSNQDCRCSTIAPSEEKTDGVIYNGVVAHITAAAPKGPRYNDKMTEDQRKDISNGIFLCANCSVLIDKNNGVDYSEDILRQWKVEHEKWVRDTLNKRPVQTLSEISGEIVTEGKGTVTGVATKRPTKINPGTIIRTSGEGNITGLKIE